jgi:hypothetical protein
VDEKRKLSEQVKVIKKSKFLYTNITTAYDKNENKACERFVHNVMKVLQQEENINALSSVTVMCGQPQISNITVHFFT